MMLNRKEKQSDSTEHGLCEFIEYILLFYSYKKLLYINIFLFK